MERQYQVILSIGSNQGDRLYNLQKATESINRHIGTVVKVSRVYETPAWGFESTPFYNAALLVHTLLKPFSLLKKILDLEKKMGRIRQEEKGYQARIIDIDIITFDECEIATETLSVPHPHMQNRRFVLQPASDLIWEWKHPVFKSTLQQLLDACPDKSSCLPVAKLTLPIHSLRLEKFNYIVIEGNIGSGKTTLATRLAADFNARLILERFADNAFLPKFYKDPGRFAFPLEMSFLADRFQQLSDDLSQFDLFSDFVVADYHMYKSLIFAKNTLAQEEFHLYKTLFHIVYKEIPQPDLYVYLYQDVEILLKNIRKRGRVYEQNISTDYLQMIQQGYLDFMKNLTGTEVLILDVSEKDFVKRQEDYIWVLEQITNRERLR